MRMRECVFFFKGGLIAERPPEEGDSPAHPWERRGPGRKIRVQIARALPRRAAYSRRIRTCWRGGRGRRGVSSGDVNETSLVCKNERAGNEKISLLRSRATIDCDTLGKSNF